MIITGISNKAAQGPSSGRIFFFRCIFLVLRGSTVSMKLVLAYPLPAPISSEKDENGVLEISDASGSKTYLIVKCLSRSKRGAPSTARQTPTNASGVLLIWDSYVVHTARASRPPLAYAKYSEEFQHITRFSLELGTTLRFYTSTFCNMDSKMIYNIFLVHRECIN